jgi:hypothetical protein
MSDAQAERQPAQSKPDESSSPADPLAGDWSEGLPGPVRAHGLPPPARLGEMRLPPPLPPEEPLRPMETPWSEPAAPPVDPNWSMEPPANSDSPWAVAPQAVPQDWPTAPPPAPAAEEIWTAPAATPESVADWSPPPPKPVRAARSSAIPDDTAWSAPPPGAGEDLSPELAAPKWSDSAKPEFAPLPLGESLAAEDDYAPRALDDTEAASLLRPVIEDASALLRPVENAANDAPPPSGGTKKLRRMSDPVAARPPVMNRVPPPGARAEPPPVPMNLDDHPDLLVPVEDKVPPGAGNDEAAPAELVAGEHRVAIHARGGRTRRGSVTDLDLSRAQFALQPQGGGPSEIVAHSELKAIFFMLAPGEAAPVPSGQKVRVNFSDGRSIEGHRDGADLRQGFFLIPLDAQKTNTKRIYVAKGAVASVADA